MSFFANRRIQPPDGGVWARVARLALLGFLAVGAHAQAEIPPTPQAGDFLHDLAGVIDDGDEQKLRALQEQAFQQFQTPIVVVTVSRMHEYDPGSPSIESFARRWFDTWGIGSQARNTGILIIVSTGDRKGRIELGAAWERRFDAYSRRVMDQDMIPHFKTGDYGAGLLAGVARLAEMAQAGPQAQPPEPGLGQRFEDNPVTQFANQNNPLAENFGVGALILLVVAGLGCFVAAYFLPEHRKTLIIAGIVLISLAFFFWIAIILLGIFFRARGGSGRRGGGYSGGFGGGGFGGGSSGGGGASGSW